MCIKFPTLRIVPGHSSLTNSKNDIVDFVVFLAQEMNVICCNQLDAKLLSRNKSLSVDIRLMVKIVQRHDLGIKILLEGFVIFSKEINPVLRIPEGTRGTSRLN